MKVVVNDKMKEWTAAYIRSHRKDGQISIHCVFSKFNEDFRATFKIDPRAAIRLMEANGFLKGNIAKGGYAIWLAEDSGRGKFHPRRSHQKDEDTSQTQPQQLVAAAPQQENENMTKQTAAATETIEPQYSFEKVPHPETGEVNVLELIRHIMKHIGKKLPSNLEMDGGYVIAQINMTAEMCECGLSKGDVPGLTQVMQKLGLIKFSGGRTWYVLHAEAVENFITPRAYRLARSQWIKDAARKNELHKLRQFRNGATAVEGDTAEHQSELLQNLAEAAVKVETLEEALAESRAEAKATQSALKARIDELEAELKARPKDDYKAVARALMERVRSSRTSS